MNVIAKEFYLCPSLFNTTFTPLYFHPSIQSLQFISLSFIIQLKQRNIILIYIMFG